VPVAAALAFRAPGAAPVIRAPLVSRTQPVRMVDPVTVGLALAYLWGATDDGEVNVVKPAAASPPAPAPVAAPVDSAETIALKKQVAVMEAAAIKSKAAELEAATLKGQASLKGQESAALESKVAELQGQLLRMQAAEKEAAQFAVKLAEKDSMLRRMQAQIEGLQTAAAAAPAPAATGAVEAAAPVPPAGPIAPMTKEEAKQTVLEVQLVCNGRTVVAALPASSPTDALAFEASRLLSMPLGGVSMLVNGVTLTPNKALTDTAVLTYSPEGIATENVVVVASTKSEMWKAVDPSEAIAKMAREAAEQTILDVQLIHSDRTAVATIPAAATTDTLAIEAAELLGLQGELQAKGLNLLVNGVSLEPGRALAETPILGYSNNAAFTENVVVVARS